MKYLIEIAVIYYSLFAVSYFYAGSLVYLLTILLGAWNNRKQYLKDTIPVFSPPAKPPIPVSVLMPAYNEEKNIVASVRSMLFSTYPEYEVIVCNDGSTDSTLRYLIDNFDLYPCKFLPSQELPHNLVRTAYRSASVPKLMVIDKANGGKADALNCAISYSSYPLVCCTDADCLIDPLDLEKMTIPFRRDSRTIAVGGAVLPSFLRENNSQSWTFLDTIQCVEYLRSFFVGRAGWDALGCTTIISGAFGLFCKKTLVDAGGYSTDTLGEDMEISIRIQRHCLEQKIPYSVKALSAPICWTEVPPNLKSLGRQRTRWIQGLSETIWRHKSMFFKFKTGRVGSIALTYQTVFEWLAGPIELSGYLFCVFGWYFGYLSIDYLLFLAAFTIGSGFILNISAAIIDLISFKRLRTCKIFSLALVGCVVEGIIYRQIHLYWRILGIVKWVRKNKSWGELDRAGFNQATSIQTQKKI